MSIPIRHKTTYRKATNPLKITEIKKPTRKKNLLEIKIIRKTKKTIIIRKTQSIRKEKKKRRIITHDETITV